MNINANETNSLNTIPIQPEQELRHLLDTEIPEQISGLEEDSAKLQRVASYCEANYLQVLLLLSITFNSKPYIRQNVYQRISLKIHYIFSLQRRMWLLMRLKNYVCKA